MPEDTKEKDPIVNPDDADKDVIDDGDVEIELDEESMEEENETDNALA